MLGIVAAERLQWRKRRRMPGASAICTEMSLNGAQIRVLNMAEISVCVSVGVSGGLRNIAHHSSPIVPTGHSRNMMIRDFGFLPSTIDAALAIMPTKNSLAVFLFLGA